MNNVHDVSKAQAQEISEILSRIKEKGLSSSSGSSIPDVSSGDLNLDSLPSLSAPNDYYSHECNYGIVRRSNNVHARHGGAKRGRFIRRGYVAGTC